MHRSSLATSPVPPRAAAISVVCLLAAIAGGFLFEDGSQEYVLLPWLLALVPAFLFAYYRGWKGAAIALELGMIAFVAAELLRWAVGAPGLETPLMAVVLLLFVFVAFGVGWVTELLHRLNTISERNSAEVVMVVDAAGVLMRASASVERVLGHMPRDLIGRPIFDFIHPDDRESVLAVHRRGVEIPDHEEEVDLRFISHAGEWRVLESRGRNLLHDPHVRGVVVASRDVTRRRDLEEQLRRAHRMESVGRLTGGIAHDFNNILTAISAESAFVLEDTPETDPRHSSIVAIVSAAQRASELTRQLLAFSRQQVLNPKLVNLNELVTEAVRMLRRTVRENVITLWQEQEGIDHVRADPTQVRQVVINLVVNAADAMPDGGTIEIRSRNRSLDEEFGARFKYDVRAGEYVELTVSDSGIGIDPGIIDRVFEPFFSTKGDEGTGLGLSTVYGIVKQSGGYIWIESEPHVGTTITVLLPAAAAPPLHAPDAQQPTLRRSPETRSRLLVVEDDQSVRNIIERILYRAGHAVMVAESGPEALELLRSYPQIDILLTDVIMPGMSGPELARRATVERPDLRVLLMSGYTRQEIDEAKVSGDTVGFLQKPFTPPELLKAVNDRCEMVRR